MFGTTEGKPVDVIACESFKLDGEHVERGTIIKGLAVEIALELAGSGRVRAATPEAVKQVRAAAAAAAESAAATAALPDPFAAAVAAAVATALAAAGIGPAAKA